MKIIYGEGHVKEIIIKELKKIEQQFEVKICFAVETGSRAWGTSSEDSDYDVRFLYVHTLDWYLSIDQKRDVIELPINEQLDMNGWDLRKALQLFKKSNPSLLEWLHSHIVYYQEFSLLKKMKKLESQLFQPKSALFHYLNMAKGNLKDRKQSISVNSKRCLNVIRPILACKWIEKHNSFPPNELSLLIDQVINEEVVKFEIQSLIDRKVNRDQPNNKGNLSILQEFIDKEITHLEELFPLLEVLNQAVNVD